MEAGFLDSDVQELFGAEELAGDELTSDPQLHWAAQTESPSVLRLFALKLLRDSTHSSGGRRHFAVLARAVAGLDLVTQQGTSACPSQVAHAHPSDSCAVVFVEIAADLESWKLPPKFQSRGSFATALETRIETKDARHFIGSCVVDFKYVFFTHSTLESHKGFFCCGAWSHSMGDDSLCCLRLDIWTSLVETPRCIVSKICPVVDGSLGWELMMQVSVDDPILIAAGSREQRLRLFTVVLVFWAALGFDLDWQEDQTGPESRVDWWRI